MERSSFSEKLIGWYSQNKRNLPWRNTKNPYLIWLSEVILQQTRVVQGLPYYEKFAEKYPTVVDLANADEQEVLRLWQGLGYYSRARNMHTTAKIIVAKCNGVFPNNYHDLLKLKGIGPYTAAAIASFAFDERVAVVDGNVFRVLARVFGIETDIASHEAKKIFGELANELISVKNPSTHNQAIMEFGATHCTPANPDCMFCIFADSCVANATGKQQILPIKSKKVKVKNRYFDYFMIEQDGKVLMRQRLGGDIWAGLYDFYLLENEESLIDLEDIKDTFVQNILKSGMIKSSSEPMKHILTHQRIEARFWHVVANIKETLPQGFEFYSMDEIENLPKPILIDNYLKNR
ncbi:MULTISPECIES: A/G-specific adenine glycosylase [Emticicia]|uniref:A/G-specific adenine glycosylase n=1 Tax=Emticicia TaxID=312278 RepID=UPI0007D8C692|nr:MULTISPECIES: A/G-specific adenine glycosylase [Emticicia]